jgi:hypothetical protein
MSAKSGKRVSAKVKRAAIAKAFGRANVDHDEVDFLYRRRNLAIVPIPTLSGASCNTSSNIAS